MAYMYQLICLQIPTCFINEWNYTRLNIYTLTKQNTGKKNLTLYIVSHAHQGGIYLIKNTVKTNIVKQFKILWSIYIYIYIYIYCVYFNMIYSCDGKAEYSTVIASVSHDPSEIILMIWFSVSFFYYYQ